MIFATFLERRLPSDVHSDARQTNFWIPLTR